MHGHSYAKLGTAGLALRWLFEPGGYVDPRGRAFLLAHLLDSTTAVIMGSFGAIVIASAALLRTGDQVYAIFCALELALMAARLFEWRVRTARMRNTPDYVPSVDRSVLLSTAWCVLQGAMAFKIMSSGDLVLSVLSTALAVGTLGPICARNYPAPRLAFLLVLMCDLPFVAGAVASREPWLLPIVVLTPMFLIGAMQIIRAFHRSMLLLIAAEARALHLAEHDALTGILNRHGMDSALSRITPSTHRSMALLSIDLDGFKQVNDRHGHGAGDVLLIQVAERLASQLRAEDLLARVGGDEFMVVVRDIGAERAAPLVERLIEAIAGAPYEIGDGSLVQVGASIGFACLPEDAAGTVELRTRADLALYAAKGAGKGVGQRYRPQL
ncbi:GGDEF domain-containing protein [Sphingomonas mucosissima]|uniref:Putative diguanylate cyclase YegE n=1 Tax=Sphingomonas mucosissima TaxID=370959 RepID=A0A245ZH14_9SPHN|nr:GGDEF domain-containing protein [Sphingomonas mucosissima]OWK29018.1 putative diguanylate cyclase YegE [Sphingomonas mucosissima]